MLRYPRDRLPFLFGCSLDSDFSLLLVTICMHFDFTEMYGVLVLVELFRSIVRGSIRNASDHLAGNDLLITRRNIHNNTVQKRTS